jgi:hypothetical protein
MHKLNSPSISGGPFFIDQRLICLSRKFEKAARSRSRNYGINRHALALSIYSVPP